MTEADTLIEAPLMNVGGGEIPSRLALHPHHHDEHMICWSAMATVALRIDDREWLVPPTHALWVPAGTTHITATVRPGQGHVVLLDPARCSITWSEPTAVLITPLIRELILHLGSHREERELRAYIEPLLLALLEPVPSNTFQLPLPVDPRARLIAETLIADPADRRDLTAWALHTHSSVRTLSRLFTRETGMTFVGWRAHLRVRAALTHLADGTPVSATARAVGYHKPGAFAAAFHRITGQHPSAYRPGRSAR
ncbi:helix-turn-helix domain-containing protein [Nocardia callitridis]|uniref:Helix-turn-helix transcriptional regulator n=1 Tax=Nocardia callitridis TaxID=648753 RepID=A0ABP9JSD1_9NOCA